MPPTPFEIPAGFALQLMQRDVWKALPCEPTAESPDSLMDKLLIWEPPQPKGLPPATYVVSVDVGGGVGRDRTVADVLRIGTIERPDEQVAQFVSDSVDSVDFAHHLDVIGRFYSDQDGLEATMAIENNLGPGIATQAELQHHFGYSNFFVWRYFDAADPAKGFSRKIGWATTPKTRPIIMANYIKSLNSLDPRTGLPDYLVNSPFTLLELQDLQTAGHPWDAEAASGAHDDCVMAGAIGLWVAKETHYEDNEPLSDQRRRQSEELARKEQYAARFGIARPDFQNTDATYDEMEGREETLYEEREGTYE